jgi:transposase
MRSLLREFGVAVPLGSKRFMNDFHRLLAEKQDRLPERVRRTVTSLWDEVRDLEQRIDDVGNELSAVAQQEPVIQALMQIPGFGVLTATAVFATVADIHAFRNGRQLACWFGLTPREFSSGSRRRLGRISKQGDPYLRTLLIHGARAVLLAARSAQRRGSSLDRLRTWALDLQERRGHNKAAVALANKLARIVWATWRFERDFSSRT